MNPTPLLGTGLTICAALSSLLAATCSSGAEDEFITPTPPPVSPTATATSLPTASPVPTATSTPMPTSTPVPTVVLQDPSPTAASAASYSIEFVSSEDCEDGISRELLPMRSIELQSGELTAGVVAEVANTSEQRRQGLMCRAVVPAGTGMLFEFAQASQLGFWMFNTYVPLDIIYLDAELRHVGSATMQPCPRPDGFADGEWSSHCAAASGDYGSDGPAMYALELPAGWLESLGFTTDTLQDLVVQW